MNGSVLAGVDRRKIMRSFLDGQRVSTRVYVHTTANEAEKKTAGGCDGSVIVFQTPPSICSGQGCALKPLQCFNLLPSVHCGYKTENAHSLDYM